LIPAAPAAPAADPAKPVDPNSPKAYLLAEGVQGNGEKPEWFKSEKYKSVADQAQAYVDLEKRFGSFVGAPKDGKYDTKLPENIGVELDGEHPLLDGFTKWASKNQLSQAGYTELLGMLGQYEAAQLPDWGTIKTAVGENADARIEAVTKWGAANLDAQGYSDLRTACGGANAAAVLKVIEAAIAKTKQPALPKPGQDNVQTGDDKLVAINAKKAVKNADGRTLRYFTDEKYRAEIEKELRDYYASIAA
jgi:hypothetical protein